MHMLIAGVSVDSAVADGISAWSYVKVLLFLCGLLCLVYVLAQVAARKLPIGRGSGAGVLGVVDRLQLEPRRVVYVLRAGSQYMAVASSERGVEFLAPLDPSAVEHGRVSERQSEIAR